MLKSFETVKEFDFHIAALFSLDFRDIEKVKAVDSFFGDIVGKNQLDGIAYATEGKSEIPCGNIRFTAFPFFVNALNLVLDFFTVKKSDCAFLGQNITRLCSSLTTATRKAVVGAK